jgi:hypothetical protein
MTSADLLAADDRCSRAGFFSRDWELSRLHPTEILRRSVDAGLMSEESDPGQAAGDHVMTLAADRGIDIEGSGVYPIALHCAALADIVTTLLRSGSPWARPVDKVLESSNWSSSAYLDQSGLRLHRVLLVDRISDERTKAEKLGWKTLGEQAIYDLPMTIHVVVLGQRRSGKYHGVFSKGFLHPRSRTLRILKRSGESFGKEWSVAWREDHDTISRDKWIDQMQEDGVLDDCLLEIDCNPPDVSSEIRRLAESKLLKIGRQKEIPDPNISQCWWPVPCQFSGACSRFTVPSEREGFIHSRSSAI